VGGVAFFPGIGRVGGTPFFIRGEQKYPVCIFLLIHTGFFKIWGGYHFFGLKGSPSHLNSDSDLRPTMHVLPKYYSTFRRLSFCVPMLYLGDCDTNYSFITRVVS
jgi:hypothetical protein